MAMMTDSRTCEIFGERPQGIGEWLFGWLVGDQ
jgi:hypothetical protein